ncbi:MAG: NAD-dependent protein deacylase [Bacteroidaceae bacterium]|nr:NAD-dependent protein deacylase [Bacteroidaceae bacterium]
MRKIAVLTGAGMSVESGLSTFRGGGGLWDEYPVEKVATPEGYAADPSLVLSFYNKRRRELLLVEPNEGHRLVAQLEKDNNVVVITQNVDDLHERAGSTNVIHLHGELMKVCSSRNPNDSRYIKRLSPEAPEITLGDLADDGSQLRPFIVWFGEAVPLMEDAIKAVSDIDVFIIIGTSLNVYPAAGLLNYIPYGVPVYLIDPNNVPVNGVCNLTHIRSGASDGMRKIINDCL